MSYLFEPPTYVERPDTGNRLVDCFVKVSRGYTVLKHASSYETLSYPTVDQLSAAVAVYLGGHISVVSDAEAALLAAAGFTGLTNIVATSGYVDIYSDHYMGA